MIDNLKANLGKVLEIAQSDHDALAAQMQAAVDDANRRAEVLAERLKKAGEREEEMKKHSSEVQTVIRQLSEENARLKSQVSQMLSHPDVRKSRREELEKKANELLKQAQELKEPEAEKVQVEQTDHEEDPRRNG